MIRTVPHKMALLLLALLATSGVFGGVTGLLMIAPFFVLMGFLLAGFYPGEWIIEAVVEAIASRPRLRRVLSTGLPRTKLLVRGILLAAAPGSRAPPAIVRS